MNDKQIETVSWIAVYVLVGILAVVAITDLWLIRAKPAGPNVSSTIWNLAKQYPVIVLIIGIVLGHLLWPQHG